MKEIICADALKWMQSTNKRGAIVTSLPDADEVGLSPDEWSKWFVRAVGLALDITPPKAPSIFYQTDRKTDGRVLSKAALLFEVAGSKGLRMLWHKIALRHDVGMKDLYRPGYTHMIAFSRAGTCGTATPDVFERGDMVYPNAMGLKAAQIAAQFAGACCDLIIDPFCGQGTVPAVADALGFDAIGIDIDQKQCAKAEKLTIKRGAPR